MVFANDSLTKASWEACCTRIESAPPGKAFREFKSIWDPQWKMNPGKIIDPYGMTENLRIGPDYNPPQPQTYFAFPADRHSFARAACCL